MSLSNYNPEMCQGYSMQMVMMFGNFITDPLYKGSIIQQKRTVSISRSMTACVELMYSSEICSE